MDNMEKIIFNKVYQIQHIVRGRYNPEEFMNIIQECFFLKLLPNNLDEYKDIFNSEDLQYKIKKDTLLNGIIKHLFRIIDEDVFNSIRDIFDDEEFKSVCNKYKASDIFEMVIDFKYRNNRHVYYKTSPSINKLMGRLFENKTFRTLYDPAIGTGTLTKNISKYHDDISIYGQDISEDELNTCKMMLILDGRISDIKNIKLGNTIINPMHTEKGGLQKFDCIVSSPPLGLKEWGYSEVLDDKYNRFKRGVPSKNSGDYAFISHIVESLDENGIAVVIVAGGTLFRGGTEGRIRKQLIEENLIDAIIALPNNTMYGTALPLNLLILNKNKSNREILFVDVLNNMESSRILTVLSDDMIEKIGKTYDKYEEEVGFSRLVGFDEVEKNEFNLSIARYVSAVKKEEIIDVKAIKTDIFELELKLKKIQLELSKYM